MRFGLLIRCNLIGHQMVVKFNHVCVSYEFLRERGAESQNILRSLYRVILKYIPIFKGLIPSIILRKKIEKQKHFLINYIPNE